ncbi:MAG: nitroreductase [Bacteroidota bacterium]
MSTINQSIRSRKSIYPIQFIDKPVPVEVLKELLVNANHAPTHRLTEPWRFKVFYDAGKKSLSEFLANKYKETISDFQEAKYEKIKNNVLKSGAIIAIVLHRDEEERVPEWEEVAAVACSVQNIWIACQQYDLGGYWSTPPLVKYLGELVPLKPNEKCIGFFYLGYHEANDRIMPKKPIEEKVEWVME